MLKDIEVVDGRELHTNLAIVSKKPGVYAWYPRLSLDDMSAKGFRQSVDDQLASSSTLPRVRGKIGPCEAELILKNAALTNKKRNICDDLARKPAQRSRFSLALLSASIFQPPLYVGKADSLRMRIKNHRDGLTDFGQEMTTQNLMPDSLVVAYVLLENVPKKSNELLEYILSLVSTPPFLKRYG